MQNYVILRKKVPFELLFREEHCDVLMYFFVNNLTRKQEKDFTTYLPTEMRYCLQTLVFFEPFLPLDRSSTCFEDGGL